MRVGNEGFYTGLKLAAERCLCIVDAVLEAFKNTAFGGLFPLTPLCPELCLNGLEEDSCGLIGSTAEIQEAIAAKGNFPVIGTPVSQSSLGSGCYGYHSN